MGVVAELGPERVAFAVDQPFEHVADAAEWFDSVPLDKADGRRSAGSACRR